MNIDDSQIGFVKIIAFFFSVPILTITFLGKESMNMKQGFPIIGKCAEPDQVHGNSQWEEPTA